MLEVTLKLSPKESQCLLKAPGRTPPPVNIRLAGTSVPSFTVRPAHPGDFARCACVYMGVYMRVGGLIWVPEDERGRRGDERGGSGPGNDASRGSQGGTGEEAHGPGEPQMCSIMFSKSDGGRHSASLPLSDESEWFPAPQDG